MSAKDTKGKTTQVVCGSTTWQGVVQMVNGSTAKPAKASSVQGAAPDVTGPMDLSTS
jgi:hypothetical protein